MVKRVLRTVNAETIRIHAPAGTERDRLIEKSAGQGAVYAVDWRNPRKQVSGGVVRLEPPTRPLVGREAPVDATRYSP